MSTSQGSRFYTLLQREFREYRNSLFWTPVVTGSVLALLMLASVLLVNRVSVFGDVILDTLIREHRGFNVQVTMVEDERFSVPVLVIDGGELANALEEPGVPSPPPAPGAPEYSVSIEENAPAEQWNFSREWRFDPDGPDDDPEAPDADGAGDGEDMQGRELNALLTVLHWILMFILLLTSGNYLLGSLYDDRKDRSILFFRSLPVSEWEVVLSKFVMALLVAPLIYIAVSILLQLVYVLLLLLLVWRMDQSPSETILSNVDFVALLGDPISGWLLTALWIAPLYAYLLFASSLAKRSPFMSAAVPVLALTIAEGVILGTDWVGDAVQNHFPHVTDNSAVGFYLLGPSWNGIDLVSMGAGLLFAGVALAGAVWLRRYRWEL